MREFKIENGEIISVERYKQRRQKIYITIVDIDPSITEWDLRVMLLSYGEINYLKFFTYNDGYSKAVFCYE